MKLLGWLILTFGFIIGHIIDKIYEITLSPSTWFSTGCLTGMLVVFCFAYSTIEGG